MKELIKNLKENNQDFEFYPTTKEIVEVIAKNLFYVYSNRYSILDIGAGNGNFFKLLEEINPKDEYQKDYDINITKFAIEKSEILINAMPSDIFIVGTDFYQQTLMDKKVDIIFCNPPYSEYKEWVIKIISEANAKNIYLVIPERWKKEKEILYTIKKRKGEYKILNSFDFLNAERQARAKVDIIKISLECGRNEIITDPFDIWFDTTFKIETNIDEIPNYTQEIFKKKSIKDNLIKGQNLIERLEELYLNDMDNLLNNYRAIEKLDFQILKELGVNLRALKEGLKLKIEGLKHLYWKELFDNLKTITDRLTKNSREKLLEKLNENTNVDYTASNAYAIVIWVLKNANEYFDKQLLEVYKWMSDRDNIKNYKSNSHFIEDGWRYNKYHDKHEKYMLDYRCVFIGRNNFKSDGCWSYDYENNLNKSTHDHINDIITIALNLGFTTKENSYRFDWEPGKENIFYLDNDGILMNIKAYKNGNIHCKFNKKFIKKLNIEAGRLNNWIKSPEEASEEMNIPLKEVKELYNTNLQLTLSNIKLLM
jgi:predicted RNA methylase